MPAIQPFIVTESPYQLFGEESAPYHVTEWQVSSIRIFSCHSPTVIRYKRRQQDSNDPSIGESSADMACQRLHELWLYRWKQ